MTQDELKPRDHAEAVALFRAQLIGALVCRTDWTHGDLADELRELSTVPVRPPGADTTRCYAPSTLERWYYAWRKYGLEGLRSRRRSDSGHGRVLTDAQRELLLSIRREHPRVATTVIRRTLQDDGRLPADAVSDTTLRRLFAEHGLDRATLRRTSPDEGERRRWQAALPHDVWHSDVMHGPALKIGDRSVPLRIHALLDDCSRYVVAIQACTTEREVEMLALMAKALRGHPSPTTLYLDNGATYIGETLRTACGRLGIALVHARPYDPQSRGKMERFWRTLREQCIDHMGSMSSLHDVQVRIAAWLERHYLVAPHAGLLGRSPVQVLTERGTSVQRTPIEESLLREALTVRQSRRVRGDGTLEVAGTTFELSQGFLAGHKVTVARSLLEPTAPPWVEHDEQRLHLRRVDPVANGNRRRARRAKRGIDAIPFDPPGAMLRALTKPPGRGR